MDQVVFKERDSRLDSFKGFLILLVILGHLIETSENSSVNNCLWQFIYLFHMPAFVLISGFFTDNQKTERSFWKSLSGIVIPLFIFQIIGVSFSYLFLHQEFGPSILITPFWILWYLLSLIFWRIMLFYSPRGMLDKPSVYLLITIIISIASGLLPYGRILSFQRTLTFYPFFLFGYYMRMGVFKTRMWPDKISFGVIIICIILVSCNAFCAPIEKVKVLLRGVGQYSISDIPLKLLLFVFSFLLALSFFNIIPSNRSLAFIGKNSLFFYLYHGLIIRFVVQPLVKSFQLPQNLLFTVLYFGFVVGVIFLIKRIPFFKWIVNPFIARNTKA